MRPAARRRRAACAPIFMVRVVAGALALVSACTPADAWEPPLPADIERVDPAVEALVRTAVEAARRDPNDAGAVYRLARIFDSNDIQAPAQDCYRRAVALDPDDARAWYGLGRKLVEEGRSAEALVAFRRVNELEPDYAPAHRRAGSLLFDEGRLDEARVAFEAALARSDRGTAAHVGLARVLFQSGDHARVVEILTRALEREPRDGQAHYLLGMSLRALERLDEAAIHLALGQARGGGGEADPWLDDGRAYRLSPRAMLDDASAMQVDGVPDRAAAHLTALLAREPEHVEALNNLAILYMELGRMDDARNALERAAAARPDFFATELNVAGWYLRAGSAGDSLAHAERATELAPENAQTWFSKGLALGVLERWDAAYVSMRKAYALDAGSLQALGGLAELCHRMGRLPEAAGYLETAVARDPASTRYRHDLAFTYLKLGRLDDAERNARVALELDPSNAGARKLLANVEQARGQR